MEVAARGTLTARRMDPAIQPEGPGLLPPQPRRRASMIISSVTRKEGALGTEHPPGREPSGCSERSAAIFSASFRRLGPNAIVSAVLFLPSLAFAVFHFAGEIPQWGKTGSHFKQCFTTSTFANASVIPQPRMYVSLFSSRHCLRAPFAQRSARYPRVGSFISYLPCFYSCVFLSSCCVSLYFFRHSSSDRLSKPSSTNTAQIAQPF